MSGAAHSLRAHMRRRLFVWASITIVATFLAAIGGMWLLGGPAGPTWRKDLERSRVFIAKRMAHHWNDPAERDRFAETLAEEMDVVVNVQDAHHDALSQYGGVCRGHRFESPIVKDGNLLGYLRICPTTNRWKQTPALGWIVAGAAAALVLWIASSLITRRLGRPIFELARVAEAIGAGNLSARAKLSCAHMDTEEELLAEVLNRMASRIEAQIENQRAMLAAVSHEIRSPLARMRIAIELTRDGDMSHLDKMEQEIEDLDSLVAELLAHSRLDFSALEMKDLDAGTLAKRSIELAHVSPDLFDNTGPKITLQGDATLLTRAVANLLDNARKHAGGATKLRVEQTDEKISFIVEDNGPGFAEGEEEKIFAPFYRRGSAPQSVGLGLALVRRIAEAHGGTATAKNKQGGGGIVSMEIRQRAVPHTEDAPIGLGLLGARA